MHDFLLNYGYPALFLLSFLASTLIPLGSEWLLVTMIVNHHDPAASVAVATLGNYLGGCTTYAIGIFSGSFIIRRVLRIDEQAELRARRAYGTYGSWSLLFSWLPLVGDPLCLVAGMGRVDFIRFSLLVFAGKLFRYAFIAWATVAGASFT